MKRHDDFLPASGSGLKIVLLIVVLFLSLSLSLFLSLFFRREEGEQFFSRSFDFVASGNS